MSILYINVLRSWYLKNIAITVFILNLNMCLVKHI